ncbi:MAG: asparagine synthase (glutamine-hydrolyzing) [Planctomycetes bacterium]|nr:asparagine synthase (glutamine-hydrolyzing) [Planctomycetota bacterium]
MCGLVALLALESPVDPQSLSRALLALQHRGPDGAGTWVSPDRRVGLGHARLAVVDVAGGAQPIANEHGTLHLIVNGELYFSDDLRADLELRGHHFRSRSDSEVVLHLYEEYGVDCLARLRGEFAFVLWDGPRRRLFAARDRFGIRPLCYAVHGDVLYLASEAKALFAAGLSAAWDPDAFFHAASLQYVPPDRTLFRGVRQLQPGCALLAGAEGLRTFRYWDLDYRREARPAAGTDETGCIRELRARLEDAVRVRLRADVPIACQLSGGLDSSAVVALTARLGSRAPDCFTVSFEHEGYDESAAAAEVAAHVGAPLHTVRVTQTDLVEHLEAAVAQGEGLAINGHLVGKYLLARAIHTAGYKVVLTGEGSDEVLAGYAHLRQDLLQEGGGGGGFEPDRRARLARLKDGNLPSAGLMLAEGEGLPLDAVRGALGFVPAFLQAKATLGHRMQGLLADGFLARFQGRDPYGECLRDMDVAGRLAGRHPVDQSSYLWCKLALANYILRTLGDGMEMAHAVEGRLPFLDHELFAFARTLPLSLKIRGDVEKYVLREAVRDLLPDAVYRRPKQPFLAPPLALFGNTRTAGFLQDTLRGADLAVVPFLDPARVRALLDRLPGLPTRERVATDAALMMALSAVCLQRRYRLGSDVA